MGEGDRDRWSSRGARHLGRRARVLSLCLVLCGCSETVPPNPAVRGPVGVASSSAAPLEPHPVDRDGAPATSAASSAQAPPVAAPPTGSEATTSLSAWWARHSKAPPPPSDAVGSALRLGDGARDAFLAERVELPEAGTRGGPRHTYRVLRVASVWVVLRAEPRRVLDLPIAFDVMDKEDVHEPPIFELSIWQDPSDGALVVEEPAARPCSVARRELSVRRAAEREPGARAWIDFDASLVDRVCRSAGRHAWDERTGRFVRRAVGVSGP